MTITHDNEQLECPACKNPKGMHLHSCSRFNTYPVLQYHMLQAKKSKEQLEMDVLQWYIETKDEKFAKRFNIRTNANRI